MEDGCAFVCVWVGGCIMGESEGEGVGAVFFFFSCISKGLRRIVLRILQAGWRYCSRRKAGIDS